MSFARFLSEYVIFLHVIADNEKSCVNYHLNDGGKKLGHALLYHKQAGYSLCDYTCKERAEDKQSYNKGKISYCRTLILIALKYLAVDKEINY